MEDTPFLVKLHTKNHESPYLWGRLGKYVNVTWGPISLHNCYLFNNFGILMPGFKLGTYYMKGQHSNPIVTVRPYFQHDFSISSKGLAIHNIETSRKQHTDIHVSLVSLLD